MTLGLDASTTTCGWSICFENRVMDAGFIDISKTTTNKLKSFLVIDFLDKHPLINKIDKINLEASLSGFSGGFTSQQTLILLSRFNAVFEYIIGEHYKLPVNLINVSTARKKVLGKSRLAGIKPKDYVKSVIPSIVPNIADFEKLNKKNNPDKRNSDIYDSIIIGLF
jgi:hypothetical protein